MSPDSATATALTLPIFLSELVLGVWLIAKEFDRSRVAAIRAAVQHTDVRTQ